MFIELLSALAIRSFSESLASSSEGCRKLVSLNNLPYQWPTLVDINSNETFINTINEYIQESNGNKYLILVPTDESKDTLKIY